MPRRDNYTLLLRAISGVLRNAQDGDLPLFAWTLGMPQPALLSMIGQCFPELGELESMPDSQYGQLAEAVPADFLALVALLRQHQTDSANKLHAEWLARAIAVACHGGRHLWEDMGLGGRDDVSRLLETYFQPLYQRNFKYLRWKRFLFAELGATRGMPEYRPPFCGKCAQCSVCFPEPLKEVTTTYGIGQQEY